MSDSKQRVNCPSCDKGYRWQPALVDRRVTCKQCGVEFRVPDAPGIGVLIEPDPIDQTDTYELDYDAKADIPASPIHHAAPANNGKCPSCNSPVREGAMLCLNCGFNMAEGKKLATPTVQALPEKEKKAMRRELAGMKWVRVGLWLNLASILMIMSIVPLTIAAAVLSIDYPLVASIIAYSYLAVGTLGSLLCLTAPKESKGRPILIVSMTLSIGTTLWLLGIDFGPISEDTFIFIGLLGALANILFLYFFVMLARYLEFDQITERAEKVFGYYIVIVVASYLLYVPLISCVVFILLMPLAIYTLFLYIALLVDLNNALTYHIQEQSA